MGRKIVQALTAAAPIVASAVGGPAAGAAVSGILGLASEKKQSRADVRSPSFVAPQAAQQADPAAEAAGRRKAVRLQASQASNASRFFGGGSGSRFFGD